MNYLINKVEDKIYTINDKDGAVVYVGNTFEECLDEIQSGRLDTSLEMCDFYCIKGEL